MRKRRKSRELALQVLYHWDVTGQDAAKTLSQLQEHFSPGPGKDEYAERIVLGVLNHREEIDRLITDPGLDALGFESLAERGVKILIASSNPVST